MRQAVVDGFGRRFLHQRRGGKVGLADVQKNHGRFSVRHLVCHGTSGFAHLHHIKRLNVLGAL
ncbi:MAG: hypothetical protein ACD_23C01227G0001 [uncultured bacterium]|nr:MAG: hypothetical protein ACD_23C01227G0001 [uncultured bacterium]